MTVSLQWLGHSAFAMDVDGHLVVIDPFLTGNPLAAAKPEDLSPELILLSHAHGDHLGDTVSIAKASGAKIITNNEVANWLGGQGLENVVGGNPGGSVDAGFMKVKMTRAYHSSSFPDGSYGGVPMGFIIRAGQGDDQRTIYFAGDTDVFSDMTLIGDHGIDLAILPIGDLFTMGIADSIKAIRFVRPRLVMPMHYNTFPPLTQDAASWANHVNNETDAQPIVLDPGGDYTLA